MEDREYKLKEKELRDKLACDKVKLLHDSITTLVDLLTAVKPSITASFGDSTKWEQALTDNAYQIVEDKLIELIDKL